MYFNRGLINGREAIAFWPDKRAAGLRPDIHRAGLPDFVLHTETRSSDGMTVADVGALTPLLRWKGVFVNADAFLDTAAKCEKQGWCLALTLDTVFVRKDGTLCLIALPFEDESLGDIGTLREYLANPEGFDAFRKFNNVEAYITPPDQKTDAPDFSFFGISGPVAGSKKKVEPEAPSGDFFGLGAIGKTAPDEEEPEAMDFASIMGGELPAQPEKPAEVEPDGFTAIFGGGAPDSTPAKPEEGGLDAFTSAFGGGMDVPEKTFAPEKTEAKQPEKAGKDVFSELFGGDFPGMGAPAKADEPAKPVKPQPAGTPSEQERATPQGEEAQDKRGIVDAFQKFAKAFETFIGGEEAAEDGAAVEPEPVSEPVVEPVKPPEPVKDDGFSGMFSVFEEVEIPVPAEPEPVAEPVVEPVKPPEPVKDDGFSGMFSAFEEVEIPVPAEPDPVAEPVVEPVKPPEPVKDDDFSGMFSAFEEVDIPVAAEPEPVAEPVVEPVKPPEPVPVPEPSENAGEPGSDGSFSDVMSFFEDLLGLGAEDDAP